MSGSVQGLRLGMGRDRGRTLVERVPRHPNEYDCSREAVTRVGRDLSVPRETAVASMFL